MKKLLLLLAIPVLLTSCEVFKTAKLLKSGTVAQNNYLSSTNFTFDTHVKVPVKIKDKTYTFIFDTGAGVSVISETLAKELGLKPRSTSKTVDGQKNETVLNFYLLDAMSIGDVQFLNQPFAGADLTKMDCFGQEFDGIIGSNLMSKAVWFIDNENKKITITDDVNKLPEMPNVQIVSFKTINSGPLLNLNPFFNLTIPGFVENKPIEFDMGSSGGFILNKKIVVKSTATTSQFSVGNSAQGLLGRNITDTTYYFVADNFTIDKTKVTDEVTVRYKGKGTPTVGMDFLKNYNIILDWTKNQISLAKIRPHTKEKSMPYGFKIGRDKSVVVINEILNNSDAQKKGLKLGDKIKTINQIDFQSKDAESDCVKLKRFKSMSADEITVQILREDKILSYRINQN
jgi:hypothetical protein